MCYNVKIKRFSKLLQYWKSLYRPNEEVPRICLWIFHCWTTVFYNLRLTSTASSSTAASTIKCT